MTVDASPPTERVTVVIPTRGRLASLGRALDSVLTQARPHGCTLEIVVVDNDPAGGARDLVDRHSRESTPGAISEIRHVVEHRNGVAQARNRGLSEASGSLIAFLDDDQTAQPGWLAELVTAMAAVHGAADAAFGRVVPIWDTPPAARAEPLAQRIFGRDLGGTGRKVEPGALASLGTGNSIFRRDCLVRADGFDERFGVTGGEDSVLVHRLAAMGATFRWCPSAVAQEHVEPARLLPAALLWRRFSEGQIRTTAMVASAATHARSRTAARWMLVGLGQTAASGTRSLATRDPARRLMRRGDLVAGLGKILWMPPLRLNRMLWPRRIEFGTPERLDRGVADGLAPSPGPAPARSFGRVTTIVRRLRGMITWRQSRRSCFDVPMAPMELPRRTRLVSFCFDDFPDSAVEAGAAILERHGGRGTFYGAFGAFPGAARHIERLRSSGHEVGCHTYGHVDVRECSMAELESDLERNRLARADVESSGDQTGTGFAFPFGLENASARQMLAARFDSLRTAYAGVSRHRFDAMALPAYELSSRKAHRVKAAVGLWRVQRRGGWVIFFTHGVTARATPSSFDTAAFERLVCRAAASATILPVGEVVRRATRHVAPAGA